MTQYYISSINASFRLHDMYMILKTIKSFPSDIKWPIECLGNGYWFLFPFLHESYQPLSFSFHNAWKMRQVKKLHSYKLFPLPVNIKTNPSLPCPYCSKYQIFLWIKTEPIKYKLKLVSTTSLTIYKFYMLHLCHRLPLSLWNSSLETASAQESKYFCRVSTCLHKMSRKVSISASFSRNLCPFWAEGNRSKEMQSKAVRKKIHVSSRFNQARPYKKKKKK